MSDEIKQRLQDSSAKCVKAYEAWCADKKSEAAAQTLHDAVHELRKVASRLEIELVSSKRDTGGKNSMSTPKHRDAKPQRSKVDGNKADKDDTKAKAVKDSLKGGSKKTESDEEGEEE